MHRRMTAVCALALAFALAQPADAAEVRVTIENLAPTNGNFLTPAWVGFHDGSFDVYDLGAPASAELERLAEDGNTAPLAQAFLGSGAGQVEGTITGPAGAIPPGRTGSMTFRLDGRAPSSRFMSYASMIIPSNDAFVANAASDAHAVFDELGNFLGGEFILRGSRVRDAGTEVNDEIPANTAFFGQAAPDTGVVEGGVIQVHPGFNPVGSGGILDNPNFAGAELTRPGYQIARITLTLVPDTRIRFPLSPGQENPPVASDATGVCYGSLNGAQNRFELECEHDVVDPTAAHIHQAVGGVNGPVIFDLGDPTSPIHRVWQPSPEEVAALLAGELYVNVHSQAFPDGEIRGQIDGCFAGPTGLCLNRNRFQATARWATPDGQSGAGRVVELTDDTGFFYFFSADNIELTLMVLDACDGFDRFWVFASGLTNVEVELVVEDTLTGESRTYRNVQGNDFEPILDTNAFATCP